MQAVHPLGGSPAERPWTQTGYGLGLMSGAMGEAGRAIGHSGGGPFSVAAVYHFPDAEEPCTTPALPRERRKALPSLKRQGFHACRRQKGDDHTTLTARSPMPSIWPRSLSPRCTAPTPEGVPEKMTSPGCNTNRPER